MSCELPLAVACEAQRQALEAELKAWTEQASSPAQVEQAIRVFLERLEPPQRP